MQVKIMFISNINMLSLLEAFATPKGANYILLDSKHECVQHTATRTLHLP